MKPQPKSHIDDLPSRVRIKKTLFDNLTNLGKNMGKDMTTLEVIELLYNDFIKHGDATITTAPLVRPIVTTSSRIASSPFSPEEDFFVSEHYYELLFESLY